MNCHSSVCIPIAFLFSASLAAAEPPEPAAPSDAAEPASEASTEPVTSHPSPGHPTTVPPRNPSSGYRYPSGAASASPSWQSQSHWPKRIPYYEDEPVPDGYRIVTHPSWGLTGTGIGLFGGAWVGSVMAAIMLDDAPDGTDDPNFDDDYTPLFIPIAGPFAAIATADASGTGAAILALDGAVQLGSVALIIAGIAAPATELERKEVPWRFSPMVSSGSAGATFEAAF